jgi:hypothetical protein
MTARDIPPYHIAMESNVLRHGDPSYDGVERGPGSDSTQFPLVGLGQSSHLVYDDPVLGH